MSSFLNHLFSKLFSYLDAESQYKKGHELLNAADKLLAMIHAASQRANQDNDRIKFLIEKADYVYKQLSKFKEATKNQVGDKYVYYITNSAFY